VRTITEQHADDRGQIVALVLDPQLEHQLRSGLGEEGFTMPAEPLMDLVRRTAEAWKFAMEQGLDKTVMLCDFRIRAQLAAMLGRQIPGLPVLAYDEIAAGTPIQTLRTVNLLPAVETTAKNA
jgi:flagellar biosynthesis component FlhA